MSPPNDERRPGEGRQIVRLTGRVAASMPRHGDNYQHQMAELDIEFVRQSFRRSWQPEVRRLRRLLREAA